MHWPKRIWQSRRAIMSVFLSTFSTLRCVIASVFLSTQGRSAHLLPCLGQPESRQEAPKRLAGKQTGGQSPETSHSLKDFRRASCSLLFAWSSGGLCNLIGDRRVALAAEVRQPFRNIFGREFLALLRVDALQGSVERRGVVAPDNPPLLKHFLECRGVLPRHKIPGWRVGIGRRR